MTKRKEAEPIGSASCSLVLSLPQYADFGSEIFAIRRTPRARFVELERGSHHIRLLEPAGKLGSSPFSETAANEPHKCFSRDRILLTLRTTKYKMVRTHARTCIFCCSWLAIRDANIASCSTSASVAMMSALCESLFGFSVASIVTTLPSNMATASVP